MPSTVPPPPPAPPFCRACPSTNFSCKHSCLQVPLIGGIAARIVDCVPVDNKGGKAGGSGSQAIATRLLRMFGKEALANGGTVAAAASQQEPAPEGEALSSNGGGAAKSKPTVAEENWARGWRGNPLLLFPEGTTSNGSCLLRFKTGVFAGGVPVHPVTVKYEARRFSPAFERYATAGRRPPPLMMIRSLLSKDETEKGKGTSSGSGRVLR